MQYPFSHLDIVGVSRSSMARIVIAAASKLYGNQATSNEALYLLIASERTVAQSDKIDHDSFP